MLHREDDYVAPRREVGVTVLALIATLAALTMLGRYLTGVWEHEWAREHPWTLLQFGISLAVVVALLYGNLVYQVSRLGYHLRRARHTPPPYEQLLATQADKPLPTLTILVPSYKEDLETIRQTLLSAALQDYPGRRVVLLLDDPPQPTDPDDRAQLDAARRLPDMLTADLAAPRGAVEAAANAFAARRDATWDARAELMHLLDAFAEADAWLAAQAAEAAAAPDHTTRHFGRLVFEAHRDLLRPIAQDLTRRLGDDTVTPDEIARHYVWLVAQFQVELTAFERKRYVNLGHEPNKAANLNSYLGLMGKTVRPDWTHDGPALVPADAAAPDAFTVPDPDYVITLDADSLLAPEYARRLTAIMETPGNERLAVAQTPYSAIPGAPGLVERIAGATTDIQYIVHQGFTWVGATFWVGANALLRKRALDDIRAEEQECGYTVPRFIQDRTVIEDTESSLDLVMRGWQLHNEPERLAYSATPPDFGALLIQRRRWANGGLLILPKLVEYAVSHRWSWRRPLELVIRAHYLASPFLTSIALLTLLILPANPAFMTPWLIITGLPYAVLYWRDLVQLGYRRLDFLRVYAFNWLLLPIQSAGVVKSLQQAITRQKIPFGRTPKVEGRTAAPPWAVAAQWAMFLLALNAALWTAVDGRWAYVVFSVLTAVTFGYAVLAFVGPRDALEDLRPTGRAVIHRLAGLPFVHQRYSAGNKA